MRVGIAFLAALGAVVVAANSLVGAEAKQRPNVLYIMSDDHAYQAISAYGYGLNKTPNIDRLASEGMRFNRCLTTNSLCGPSRAVLLTGKYSHMNGFYDNTSSRFDGSQMTFPKLLQKAGYQTAMIGKWHLVTDPTGFDFWEILPGQGQYYNPPMILNGKKIVRQGYVTDLITDEAIDWLKNKRDKSKPFLLLCHHKAPHREWEPNLSQLHDYDGVKFPEPSTLFDDYAGRGKAEHEQDMMIKSTMNAHDLKLIPPRDLNAEQRKVWDAYYEPRNAAFLKENLTGKALIEWKYQRYLHDYFATIQSIDDSVGKLMAYLKESGLDKNTIVFYTSDQGFYLGEHGWFDKRWIFEESLRTPLLVRWPGVVQPGSVDKTDIVSNLDYAETILDMAGVAVPPEMQGRSMAPVLEGKTPADWRKAFYYHYYEHPAVHNVAKHYGIVTNRYKLVYFYEPEMNYWELFDLKTDPHEMKSVYNDPKYAEVQKDLRQQLTDLRTQLKDPAQDAPESIIHVGKRAAGPRAKPLNAWVLDDHFDKNLDMTMTSAPGKSAPIKLDAGQDGHKALILDGQSYVNIPRTAKLNPAVGAWTVEATFKSEKPDGVVFADGGASNGYCLWLEGGKLHFAVVCDDDLNQIDDKSDIVGKWVTVRASFDDHGMTLDIEGAPPIRGKLSQPMKHEPHENMQIGADLGSQVTGQEHPKFEGLIESVRVYSGKAK